MAEPNEKHMEEARRWAKKNAGGSTLAIEAIYAQGLADMEMRIVKFLLGHGYEPRSPAAVALSGRAQGIAENRHWDGYD